MINLDQLAWMLRGACSVLNANPDIFYEDGNEDTAKAYCYQCPVINTCREWAMVNDEEGVWGGMSAADRRAVRRGGRRLSCPACSTQNIYKDINIQICLGCGMSWS